MFFRLTLWEIQLRRMFPHDQDASTKLLESFIVFEHAGENLGKT